MHPSQAHDKVPEAHCRLTGAKHVHGDRYRLAAGRLHFLVDSKFVRVISHVAESVRFPVAADPRYRTRKQQRLQCWE